MAKILRRRLGKAEQNIKRGKNADPWSCLSCHTFRNNEIPHHPHTPAYKLGNIPLPPDCARPRRIRLSRLDKCVPRKPECALGARIGQWVEIFDRDIGLTRRGDRDADFRFSTQGFRIWIYCAGLKYGLAWA